MVYHQVVNTLQAYGPNNLFIGNHWLTPVVDFTGWIVTTNVIPQTWTLYGWSTAFFFLSDGNQYHFNRNCSVSGPVFSF